MNSSKDKLRGLKKHVEEVNHIVIDSIKEALLILTREKPLEKVTIMELCKKAGVSRMGFYNNFKTKDEIIKRIVIDLNDELVARIGSPFRDTTDDTWYTKLMEFIKEKHFIYKSIIDGGFFTEYVVYMNDLVLHDKTISDDKKYQRIIWNGGLINCIYYWMNNGSLDDSKKIAEYCHNNLKSWSI